MKGQSICPLEENIPVPLNKKKENIPVISYVTYNSKKNAVPFC
jgi:hypothetical protein